MNLEPILVHRRLFELILGASIYWLSRHLVEVCIDEGLNWQEFYRFMSRYSSGFKQICWSGMSIFDATHPCKSSGLYMGLVVGLGSFKGMGTFLSKCGIFSSNFRVDSQSKRTDEGANW